MVMGNAFIVICCIIYFLFVSSHHMNILQNLLKDHRLIVVLMGILKAFMCSIEDAFRIKN